KTHGLNLEDTHITDPEQIAKLIAVLAVAFSFAHPIGEWRTRHRPIIIKTHKRKAQSIFRAGFGLLRKILIQGVRDAVQCWQAMMKGKSPTPHTNRAPSLPT
ncbi:hypothetical protein ACTJKX_35925, partial [Labrys sp. 22185]